MYDRHYIRVVLFLKEKYIMKNKAFFLFGILIVLMLFILTVGILFFGKGDTSASQSQGRRVFGATFMTMNNPYYQVVNSRLRSEIEKRGDILLSRDATMNQDRQNEEITELIHAGAEIIFLTPVEWDNSLEGLKIAEKAGVPVIVVDAPVRDTNLVACSVISDNYQAGVLCAEHLMKTRKKAKIILLEHITARSGTERIQGFFDTIAGNPAFEIVGKGESDGQIENAMPVMEDLLKKAPDADVVMALNDPSAFGAMAAIEGKGIMDRFLVYGVDGSPEAKALIHDEMMTATSAQFPYRIARESARVAYSILDGKKAEHEIIVPVELITKENVDRFELDGWQ